MSNAIDYKRELLTLAEKLTRERFLLPGHYGIYQIVIRKEFLVLFLVSQFDWKQASLSRDTLLQDKELITYVVNECMIPQLETYFQTKLQRHCFFEPYIKDGKIWTASAILFEDQIFKDIDKCCGSDERKLASIISGYICKVYEKGPKRIRLAILDNRYIIVSVSGLISSYMKDCAYKDEMSCVIIKEMMTSLVNDAVNIACQADYQVAPEKFTEVDFEHNHIITISYIGEHIFE